ncbi:MAG: hypothetical protein WBG46_06285 [Nonlabens sp.]
MIHYKALEDQFIVWFSKANQYLVVDSLTKRIIELLDQGFKTEQLLEEIENIGKFSLSEVKERIRQVDKNIYQVLIHGFSDEMSNVERELPNNPSHSAQHRIYKIDSLLFEIQFSGKRDFLLIHPKFKHLEVLENSLQNKNDIAIKIKTVVSDGFYHLEFDGSYVNRWQSNELHYLIGRLYMLILERIHDKEESEWGAVFHASAIGDDKSNVMMMGESGSGKSTSVALLNAHGLKCIADDFVPMDKNFKVYPFPAGISIKHGSLKPLKAFYPDLNKEESYDLSINKKAIRYLPLQHDDLRYSSICKALIFVKYDPDHFHQMERMSVLEAFQILIPESWLSDDPEFVGNFLEWCSNIPCYRLRYCDAEKMVHSVRELMRS